MSAASQDVATRNGILARALIYAVLILFAVYYLLPLYVMIVNSLKPLDEIRQGNMLALPQQWTIAPWLSAWSTAQIGVSPTGLKPYFLNSVMMVVPAVALSTILGALNGYVLTKWRFKGDNIVFGLMLLACFIPFQIVLIPSARILGLTGLAGTITGLVLIHAIYGLGFTTLFFRNYYEAFPTELIRAAQIDGASFFQIFRRILLPSSGPIIVVTVIWQFTNIWNDFLFGSSFSGFNSIPLTVALNNLVNSSTGVKEYNVHFAGAILAALPTLIVYIVSGRYFVRGLMAGAVKGKPMSFLKISNLYKNYGQVEILKDINIEIDKGGFLVLVGPSGCGKSTLLNTIAGLEPITSGEIAINGNSVAGLHPSKRDIAMVFQSYALYPNMTVAGNIAFGMEIRGVPKDEREKAIKTVADILQIGHLLDRKPSQLSGGQRQRVAMGRALVRNPQVFLFDEPLSNLDAKLRVDMRTEIKRLHQRMKTTIVYVTHDQIEAMTLATKIAVLKDGVLQQFGTPAEIYNSPANMFVADFMGSPAMNLLNCRLEGGAGGLSVMLDRPGDQPLALPIKTANGALSAYSGKEIIFGVRPEALTDPDGADRNAKSIAEGECLIEVVEPAGSDTFAVTKLGGKEVVARLRADAAIHAGQKTKLAFNLDKAVFFDPKSQLRIA